MPKTSKEPEVSKLLMLTGEGHKIAKASDTKSVCGVKRIGWHYGTASDVTCKRCSDSTGA